MIRQAPCSRLLSLDYQLQFPAHGPTGATSRVREGDWRLSPLKGSGGPRGVWWLTEGVGMALQPLAGGDPAQIAGYQLRARLGAGGMGVVYLGYTALGRPGCREGGAAGTGQ